ncbi:MAG: hypothetical protein CFE31_09830 [Rhizobiales bacterium PAR1]|nr:MAG: hypothetical protein CFE31_09830 [Rhizobiales bacterium PAR1]
MTLPHDDANTLKAYFTVLREAAVQARSTGQNALFWTCADRLIALSEGRRADCLLLRAEALAGLGEIDPAKADVMAAFRVEPEMPGLAERVLGLLPPGKDRLKALVHRLRAPAEPSGALLDAIALAGFDALVLAQVEDRTIRGRLWWLGTQMPALSLHHHGHIESIVPGAQAHAAGTGFAARAPFEAPWPGDADHVELRVEKALVLPESLVRAEAPQLASKTYGEAGAEKPGLLVIVPAYGDWPSLSRCLKSVIPQLGVWQRLLVVDDASPDPDVRSGLLGLPPQVLRLRNGVNLGFAGAVNAGLALRSPGEDVLLLNSDATLPPGALARLRRLAQSAPDIATITPFSNNGEDTSVPLRFLPAPEPDDALLLSLDKAAETANGDTLIEIPNGIGFCLYVPAHALETLGGLSGAFERGYFEDVEFCLRATRAGLRNFCAPGLYVAHAGSRSFGTERQAYVRRNLARLTALFPEYEGQSAAFFRADPLKPATDRMVAAYLGAKDSARILVVPQDCPAPVARAISVDFEPEILLRPRSGGWQILSIDSAFPFKLDHEGHDLHMLLPWLQEAPVTLLSPERIDAVWRRALPENAAQILVPQGGERLQETIAPDGVIAVAAPEADVETLAAITNLAETYPSARFVLIDALTGEAESAFAKPPRLLVAGEIDANRLPDFARRAGVTALGIFPGRYGGFDPRIGVARALGLAVCDLAARS